MDSNKNYIERSDSKNTLRNFSYATDNQTVFTDPVARGAYNHFISKCMEGDYNIVKKDNMSYDKVFEMLLNEKYLFRTTILQKIFAMGKLFNNVFIEIVRDVDNKVKALNVLDSTTVKPVTKRNGDPIKYQTTVQNADGSVNVEQEWPEKDIVWIKFGDRTQGFAPVDMKALWTNLLAKEYVTRYVAWLWKTGQYRVLYNPKSASDGDIQDTLAYMKQNDTNFKVPFIFKGELETKILRDMKETEQIEKLLKYYDSQTLILLRVPPIDAGIPDASGRSNADAQSNNLAAEVTCYKKVMEDKLSFELFPKMNKGNNLIRFAPNDRFAEKQVLENIQMMRSFNASEEWIEEYLHDRGMFFGAGKLFEEPVETPMSNPRDKDTAPSRKGKGEGEANKKIGTGSQGTTREDQL